MTADSNLVFCSAQNVFGNGTTVASDDWIDWKVAQDIAGGCSPVVEVRVNTAFAGGTGVRFQLVAADAAGNNPEPLDETPQIAVADLGAGTRHLLKMSPKLKLPASTLTSLRVRVVNVGNNTAGAISALLTEEAATASPDKANAVGY